MITLSAPGPPDSTGSIVARRSTRILFAGGEKPLVVIWEEKKGGLRESSMWLVNYWTAALANGQLWMAPDGAPRHVEPPGVRSPSY